MIQIWEWIEYFVLNLAKGQIPGHLPCMATAAPVGKAMLFLFHLRPAELRARRVRTIGIDRPLVNRP